MTAACKTCGAGEQAGLRVIRPRVARTASTFADPEIRCQNCCKSTRGMFRLCKMTLQDFLARPT